MMLYLAHGRDPLSGNYQTLIVLADDEADAGDTILHEVPGFRADYIEHVKDYPGLDVQRAVVARITIPETA